MIDYKTVADGADMIVDGYAFTKDGERIRVLNLNGVGRSAVLDGKGNAIETSMDDIELRIVQRYLERNREFLEA